MKFKSRAQNRARKVFLKTLKETAPVAGTAYRLDEIVWKLERELQMKEQVLSSKPEKRVREESEVALLRSVIRRAARSPLSEAIFVGIAISDAAWEAMRQGAIKRGTSFNSEPLRDAGGGYVLYIDRRVCDELDKERAPGESYSEAIIRRGFLSPFWGDAGVSQASRLDRSPLDAVRIAEAARGLKPDAALREAVVVRGVSSPEAGPPIERREARSSSPPNRARSR